VYEEGPELDKQRCPNIVPADSAGFTPIESGNKAIPARRPRPPPPALLGNKPPGPQFVDEDDWEALEEEYGQGKKDSKARGKTEKAGEQEQEQADEEEEGDHDQQEMDEDEDEDEEKPGSLEEEMDEDLELSKFSSDEESD
jgi:hypothetical protein